MVKKLQSVIFSDSITIKCCDHKALVYYFLCTFLLHHSISSLEQRLVFYVNGKSFLPLVISNGNKAHSLESLISRFSTKKLPSPTQPTLYPYIPSYFIHISHRCFHFYSRLLNENSRVWELSLMKKGYSLRNCRNVLRY